MAGSPLRVTCRHSASPSRRLLYPLEADIRTAGGTSAKPWWLSSRQSLPPYRARAGNCRYAHRVVPLIRVPRRAFGNAWSTDQDNGLSVGTNIAARRSIPCSPIPNLPLGSNLGPARLRPRPLPAFGASFCFAQEPYPSAAIDGSQTSAPTVIQRGLARAPLGRVRL